MAVCSRMWWRWNTRMPELNTEHLTLATGVTNGENYDSPELRVRFDVLDYLHGQGWTIEQVHDLHTVSSESGNGAYLVARVDTYRYPRDSPELDVADESHQITFPVCSCADYRYSQTPDLEMSEELSPETVGTCKHCLEAFREERAKSDTAQQGLDDGF